MKFKELVAILPCHSFDDFPYYLQGEQAEDVLQTYTALWHPALIASVGKTPTWRRSEMDQHDWEDCLVVLPQVCQDDLPGFWLDEVRAQQAFVIEAAGQKRSQIVAKALAELDEAPDSPASDMVDDFFSLGLCHLLTEALSVQMRYGSVLDAGRFQTLLSDAAQAAVIHDTDTALQKLSACYDCLAESKDHFYPVDAFLIDLILVALTAMGPQLLSELKHTKAANVLISGDDLVVMDQQFPDCLVALREAVADQRVTIVGGEPNDAFPLSLNTVDDIIDHLKAGMQIYRETLGHVPTVFGRRRQGLTPVLPQLLERLGFDSALHFTLDEERFPVAGQSKFAWEGTDGTVLDAFAQLPLDASLPESVLAFPQRMGESMDSDHVATLCFAHWPGQTSVEYRDLQRASRFAPALGKFVTLKTFFEEAAHADYHNVFGPDEYRATYLQQQVAAAEPDPISRHVRRATDNALHRSTATIKVMTQLVAGQMKTEAADENSEDAESESDPTAVLNRFAAALPRGTESAAGGYLAVNPGGFERQVAIDTPRLRHPPRIDGPIRAAYRSGNYRQVIVQLPPFGFVWIAEDKEQDWMEPASKPMVDENVLRNEHLEITVHPKTGGIQSINVLGHRGNILSQQLAMRLPSGSDASGGKWGPRRPASYSTMVVSSIATDRAGPVTAALTSRGHLLDPTHQKLADFRQTVSVMRSASVVNLEIEITPHRMPQGDPWKSYYATRFAWPDDAAEVYRGVSLGMQKTDRRRLEAPQYIELRSGKLRTTLLTTGLPYHQRTGDSQLDSLLIVAGENTRRFRIGIGVNLPRAQSAAVEAMLPDPIVSDQAKPPAISQAWLFHVDTTRVFISECRTVGEGGAVEGVVLRLLEVAGRQVRAGLHVFRDVGTARKLDFAGRELARLQPVGNVVIIELTGHECCEVELLWEKADLKNDSDH